MRAHKTKKRENRIRETLLFGFWGDNRFYWNRAETIQRQHLATKNHVRRNIGLARAEARVTTWDASWTPDEERA